MLAVVGSVVALLAALFLTSDGLGQWSAGVLVNIGASVLLVVPVYLLNQRLDRRIERVRVETTSSVQELTERVETFEQEVERRIDDVAASVSSRLQEESRQDVAAFDALVETPTRESFHEAMRRANELGLISPRRGPRVCVSEEWRIFVQVDYDPDPDIGRDFEHIMFTVEDFDGAPIELILWSADLDAAEVLFRVGRAVQAATAAAKLDVKGFLGGLRDLLTVANSHPSRRPILQLCPPQWAITPERLVSYGDHRAYGVRIYNLENDNYLATMIGEKPWVDRDSFDEARMAGSALRRRLQVPEF
ncbi:hypothetical protein [Micromonospora sp. NPDC007230]|uniref:hypothetical protein n=1 Tax=Micromonospora sp. NPDC007230 TaxID=3364237 RepID=UPI0036C61DA4